MGVPVTYNVRNLMERKATTLMTALGIALTVSVLVTALALLMGLRALFAGSGDARQFLVLREGTDAELTSSVTNDAYQIIRRLPGIARTPGGEPMVSPEGLTVVNLPSLEFKDGMNVTVRGMLPVGLAMRNVEVIGGKMFEPGRRQVVVGEATARRYPDAHIGNKVRFGRGDWEVVGIFRSGESAANSEIWLDLDQLRGDFEQQGGSSSVLVRSDGANMRELMQSIKGDQRLGVNTIPEKEYYAGLTSSGLPLEILGISVAVIMAVGSAFAATNTMYAAVSRRTREIGTLRALGFGRYAILFSLILESIFLALMGGIAGVLLALPINGLTTGVGNFTTFSDVTFKFKVGLIPIGCGLLFSILIGAFGGFLPAWAASKKDIVQAMRDV
jgi:putative ABC transport system permease protein